MSKKELLNETQIRRFMTLANLEPLVKNVISEKKEDERPNQIPEDPRRSMGSKQEGVSEEAKSLSMEAEEAGEEAESPESMDIEVPADGGDADPDKAAAFEAAVKALADSLGIEIEMGGEEAAGGEEEAPDADMEAPEANGEEEESEDDNEEEQQKEMDERISLSEDSLVEAVLARVTSRLVAEARKKKKSVKEKMDMKKKEKEAAKKKKDKKEEVMEEALDGVNLAEKGKEKANVWKGHADMTMAKGEKGGKGGHEMETLTAKAEHTVTHSGKNLATLGGNKKK